MPRGWFGLIALTVFWMNVSPATFSQTNKCENAEVKAFDFQIGVWQSDADGERHEIKKILDGCAIQEVWMKANGEYAYGLKSFDAGKQRWYYSWVAAGYHQLWEGRKEGGQWRFYREWVRDGEPILSRTYWVLLADGSLERIVEQSRDAGKTWRSHVKSRFLKKP